MPKPRPPCALVHTRWGPFVDLFGRHPHVRISLDVTLLDHLRCHFLKHLHSLLFSHTGTISSNPMEWWQSVSNRLWAPCTSAPPHLHIMRLQPPISILNSDIFSVSHHHSVTPLKITQPDFNINKHLQMSYLNSGVACRKIQKSLTHFNGGTVSVHNFLNSIILLTIFFLYPVWHFLCIL